MRTFDCDLHFHGKYAGGVSENMLLPVIAENAKLKGLDVVCMADILHKKWFEHVKENLVEEPGGVYKHRQFDTYFIVGTEVECKDRVHHLIYLPSLEAALELRERVQKFGDLDGVMSGRPRLKLSGEAIAAMVKDCGGILGPAHAFTPYFSVYAHFDSLRDCYGTLADEIYFMELGLSADSYFADLIEQNHNYSFLTCSDSHSPWPIRIGREFTRMKMEKPNFESLKKALREKDECLIVMNAGLDPREGKYHMTACNACYAKYSIDEAKKLRWRCLKCKGLVKKGVRDRIFELANFKEEKHPDFRPPYLHLLPLAEIIQSALEAKSPNTAGVQQIWRDFIDNFKSEIKVLVDVPEQELKSVHAPSANKIVAFRSGWVHYIPGGGGKYGEPIICDSAEDFEKKKKELADKLAGKSEISGQKTLGEY